MPYFSLWPVRRTESGEPDNDDDDPEKRVPSPIASQSLSPVLPIPPGPSRSPSPPPNNDDDDDGDDEEEVLPPPALAPRTKSSRSIAGGSSSSKRRSHHRHQNHVQQSSLSTSYRHSPSRHHRHDHHHHYHHKDDDPPPLQNMLGEELDQDEHEQPHPPPMKKSARIDYVAGLRVRWARFRRRLGTGTSPSTTDSVVDDSAGGDSSIARHFQRNSHRVGEGGKGVVGADDDEVVAVVVDRQWTEELKSAASVSEQDGAPNKSGSHNTPGGPNSGSGGQGASGGGGGGGGGTATTEHDDSVALHASGVWALCTPLIILRWRVWPAALDFFSLRFFDARAEAHYAREHWYTRKSLAVWSALFLILNWALGAILLPGPRVLADKIFYYALAPVATFPILGMVMYDLPRDRATLYQVWLAVAVWMWSVYQVLFIFLCGFYGPVDAQGNRLDAHFTCGNKDFLGTFYYACGLPTIAMFGLRMKRFPAFVGGIVWTGCAIAFVLPHRVSWIRNVLNFDAFMLFLVYVHYMLETAERRLYTLRDQLKIQFRATQKAQVNERRAADSKRRLTSYVFHEVRVPLNTALLAVQNMEAFGVVPRAQEIEFKALEGSLSMMSKVLNDVLDFNRMDSGRFESVSRPYCFHQVMRSLFVPLRLAADARGLRFVTDLDGRIDRVARFAALTARGYASERVLRELEQSPDEDGVVLGDETRLMQIVTNLASNACKFTPEGGTLRVATELIIPGSVWTPGGDRERVDTSAGASANGANDANGAGDANGVEGASGNGIGVEKVDGSGAGVRLSATSLSLHNLRYSKPPEVVVVRIEVQDTGYGIPPKEMEQSQLFSAFNQTEQGKQQGGKGTGLGLALVRQIVKRSGGRLGVISKVGRGSTFWVELPLGVGAKTLVATGSENSLPPPRDGVADSLARGLMSNATVGEFSTQRPAAHAPPSALHGIMDQGGLVELAPKPKPGDASTSTSVITRTIHDTVIGSASLASTPEHEPSPSQAELAPSSSPSAQPVSTSGPESLDSTRLVPPTPPFAAHSSQSSSSSSTQRAESVPPRSVDGTGGRRHIGGKIEMPPPLFAQAGTATMPLGSDSTMSSTAVGSDRPGLSPTSSGSPGCAAVAELPLGIAREQKDAPKESPTITPDLHVLVVDDDPLTRMLMSRLLTRLGCKVATAENGEVALEMILGEPVSRIWPRPSPSSEQPSIKFDDDRERERERERDKEPRFAVVFLDNQMPVMSGLTAIARLREMGRKDFVVGVTGNALLSDQEEYTDAGVDHVLTKPVLERNLKSMLLIGDERRRASLRSPPLSSITSLS